MPNLKKKKKKRNLPKDGVRKSKVIEWKLKQICAKIWCQI